MTAAFVDSLAWALAVVLCIPRLRGRAGVAIPGVLVVAALLWVPLGGGSALAVLRGAAGGVSVLTVAMLAALFAARVGSTSVFASGERVLIAAAASLIGLAFYPPALGLGPVDPYAWGYEGAALPLAVGAVALLAGLAGRWILAGGLALALAAWRLQLLESPNLWDYLIDPLLAVGALVALVVCATQSKSAKRAGYNSAAAKSSMNAADAR